jgi:hypothetical protein
MIQSKPHRPSMIRCSPHFDLKWQHSQAAPPLSLPYISSYSTSDTRRSPFSIVSCIMVLEALVAVRLAGSIVQSIDFGTSLLAKAHEIYCSTIRSPATNVKLETIAARLRHIATSLSTSTSIHAVIVEQQLKDLQMRLRPLRMKDQKQLNK